MSIPPDPEKAPEVPFETTLRVKDHCLCFHVQRTARALARRFDDAFRPIGLTNSQFSLLMTLNAPVSPPMGMIADLLAIDRTTLTAALKPLQRRGLVSVDPDPSDRRSRRMALTVAGKTLLAQATPIWEREHARAEAQLGAGGPDTLRSALASLSGATRAATRGSRRPGRSSRRMP